MPEVGLGVAVLLVGAVVKNGKLQAEISRLTTVRTVMAVNSLVRKTCLKSALIGYILLLTYYLPSGRGEEFSDRFDCLNPPPH
jgi:hypothetical protein